MSNEEATDESRLENLQVESLELDSGKSTTEPGADGNQKPRRMNKTERKYARYQEKLAKSKAKKIEKKNAKKMKTQAKEAVTKT